MRKLLINEGQKFGLLAIVKESKPVSENGINKRSFLCRCECGNIITVKLYSLTTGNTKSCGCIKQKQLIERNVASAKYPAYMKKLYNTWYLMGERCNNMNNKSYKNYGGRGIKVCKRWEKFENFYEDMGDRPEALTLDRIDNDGNYEPENCRWATRKTQMNNKRNNLRLNYNGMVKNLSQWAESTGIKRETIKARLSTGLSIKKSLTA